MPFSDRQKTAALYIHIPFCEKRCNYCDFYSVANRKAAIPRYIRAVVREIELYAQEPFWQQQTFSTLFLGGGTPSLLAPEQIALLIAQAKSHFQFTPEIEITIEANPGTTGYNWLKEYFMAGVNRLSLGVQSFRADELKTLERVHSVEDIARTITDSRRAGFKNLNIDLIFAIPGQTPSRWKYSLQKAIELDPEHISCYNLMIEPGTPLDRLLQSGKVRSLTEWKERVFYNFTIDFLEAHGYQHYEVSNYAKPGYRSRHNTKYWDGSFYLGLGASAHSYNGQQRFWNAGNYIHYCQQLEKGIFPIAGEERLTPQQKRFEMIFLGLRQSAGVDLSKYRQNFHEEFVQAFAPQLNKLTHHDPPLIQFNNHHLQLTREGWLLCDSVCREFLR